MRITGRDKLKGLGKFFVFDIGLWAQPADCARGAVKVTETPG
jgi:hypothetical protein